MKQRKKNSSWMSRVSLVILACAAAVAGWWWHYGHAGTLAPAVPLEPSSKAPTVVSTGELTAYDKYISTARKKGWSPVDPIEKLSSTISKFGQVVDAKDMKRSNEFLKMLVQEFQYIVKVLVSTPSRQFDLSGLLTDAIEMLKIAHFKSAKDLLWSGHRYSRALISHHKSIPIAPILIMCFVAP